MRARGEGTKCYSECCICVTNNFRASRQPCEYWPQNNFLAETPASLRVPTAMKLITNLNIPETEVKKIALVDCKFFRGGQN